MPKSINVNVSYCKYTVVRNAIESLDWTMTDDQEDTTTLWNLWWQDVGISTDRLIKMKDFQRINHWPGMNSIHTKTGLATVIRRMEKVFPDEYRNIHPQTWSLPEDWTDFVTQFDPANENSTNDHSSHATKKVSRPVYIIKPAASCQGRGIYLIQDLNQIQDNRAAQIAQRYISKPLLVDGLKFDLRIYVCVTSVDPLRIWLFEEGLARFATTPYKKPNASNLHKITQHLTNYAINCQSSSFQFNTGGLDNGTVGSKRTLTWFRSWLNKTYGDGTANIVWGSIIDIIIKTLIAAQPHLARTYRSAVGAEATSMRCFEVLGLDVLIDAELKPWILEINHSPSLTCDTPLDTQIKFALIKETMQLLRLRGGDRKRNLATEAAAARQRLYGSSLPLNSTNTGSTKGNDNGNSNNDAQSVASSSGLRTPSVASTLTTGDDESSTPSPVPVHVRATEPSFAAFASAIPEAHALNEIKVAKKYRLIFPPPDAALIGPNVWQTNEKAYATTKANVRSHKNPDTLSNDDEEASATVVPSSLTTSSTTNMVSPTKSLVALPPTVPSSSKTNEGIPMDNGVPVPFYAPWDESKENYLQRINHYHYLLAVSTELYNVQTTANATGGRKAANAALQSTASLITEAMKTMMSKPSTESVTLVSTNGDPTHHELSAFARTLKSITQTVAEKTTNPSSTNNGKGGKPSFVSMINKVQAAKRVSTAPANATRKPIPKKENIPSENSRSKNSEEKPGEMKEFSDTLSHPIPSPLSPASVSPNSILPSAKSSPSQYLPRTSPPTLPGRTTSLATSPTMIVPKNTNASLAVGSPMEASLTNPIEPTEYVRNRPTVASSLGTTILNSMGRYPNVGSNILREHNNDNTTTTTTFPRPLVFSDHSSDTIIPKHINPSNIGTSTTITANPWLLPSSATMSNLMISTKSHSLIHNPSHSNSSRPYYKGYGNMTVVPNEFGLLGKSVPIPVANLKKTSYNSISNGKSVNPSEFLRPSTVTMLNMGGNPYQQYGEEKILRDKGMGSQGGNITGSFTMDTRTIPRTAPQKSRNATAVSTGIPDKMSIVSLEGKRFGSK